jgi:hypothetical protein
MPERIDDLVLRLTHEPASPFPGLRDAVRLVGTSAWHIGIVPRAWDAMTRGRNETTPLLASNVSARVQSAGTRYRYSSSASALGYETVQAQK